MTVKELNKSKKVLVKVDKRLDKLSTNELFPDKVREANKVLSSSTIPKIGIKQRPVAKTISRRIVSA